MRQRVMIAIALACDPKLLIADEPTTALDVTIQRQILALLKHLLQQRLGMSVLFITHDMGVVAEIADRTVVMYNGEQVETGRTEEIFANPQKPYTQGAALGRAAARLDGGRRRADAFPGGRPQDRPVGRAGRDGRYRRREPAAGARSRQSDDTLRDPLRAARQRLRPGPRSEERLLEPALRRDAGAGRRDPVAASRRPGAR